MRHALALVCFCSTTALAQFGSMRFAVNGDTLTVTLSKPVLANVPTLSGKPFSGQETTENVRTRPDGTHITQHQNAKRVIRDSQGRVRTEQQLGLGMPPKPGETGIFSLVTVRDPVAGFLYVFDDEAKLVHRFKLSSAPSIPSSIPVPRQAASGIESLGTQVIEGVEALGHRSVRTLAAGEAGNQQPITITNEYWYSKDLQQNILQKLSDPRSGDRTTRWTNISRSEPDPSLFALPEGFTVVDEADTFTITLHRH